MTVGRVHHPTCDVSVAAFGDHDAFACDDAEVWIEDEMILVSYFDDDGIVVLEGWPREGGGWELSARSRPRRAFLAPMADSPGVLEGEIDEQGEVARWRLTLGEPAALAEPSAPDAGKR